MMRFSVSSSNESRRSTSTTPLLAATRTACALRWSRSGMLRRPPRGRAVMREGRVVITRHLEQVGADRVQAMVTGNVSRMAIAAHTVHIRTRVVASGQHDPHAARPFGARRPDSHGSPA